MRALGGLAVCLVAVGHAAAVRGDPPRDGLPSTGGEQSWVSASGSGLLTLPDASTLARKHLDLGIAVDNQDRDPLRLDVIDYSVAWNYGVRSGLETYGHVVVSRAVIVAERPFVFPPPVDIIIPEGTPVPRRPYYLLYGSFPYVNRTGTSQLFKFVPGDAVFAGKVRLLQPREARPGLAASVELKLPITRRLSRLQSGAGTGAWDETLRLTAEWRWPHDSFVVSTGLTHVGQPPFGDRVIVVPPRGDASRIEMPLRLASRLQLGFGFRHVLTPSLALGAETTGAVELGGRTAAFEATAPLDITAGAQFRWKRLHLTAGVRYHANSVPSLRAEPSPLGGMIDLTSVDPDARDAYLAAIGAGAAIAYVRDRSQIAAFAPANGPPLPKGAHVLPSSDSVRSHDRFASMLVVSWRFGSGPSGQPRAADVPKRPAELLRQLPH